MIKNIIFDFDGVILDSMPIKTEAFKKLFYKFPKEKVDILINYHIQNGGISRYKKIEYFFTEILCQNISAEDVQRYAQQYSEITKIELAQKKYLIAETMKFITKNYQKYQLHIASGADENDLHYICKELNLIHFFASIHGSPTIKSDIVGNILTKNNYNIKETILIGDSINDYDAASKNIIQFYGYNNTKLKNLNNIKYINEMDAFEKSL